MSQDQLAELAGVTGQTISIAELGKKAMRADTIIGICKALDISADYLLFGSISPQFDNSPAAIGNISSVQPQARVFTAVGLYFWEDVRCFKNCIVFHTLGIYPALSDI